MIQNNLLIRRREEREGSGMEIDEDNVKRERNDRLTEKKGNVRTERESEMLMNEKQTYKKGMMRHQEV